MPEMNDLSVPQSTAGDHAHLLVRAAIGSVPMVGNAALEFFNALIAPPLQKKRDRWMESVGSKLQELMDRKQITAEDITQSEAFVSSVVQATTAAMKTASNEKLESLRNAILNSALPNAPDESRRQMYLQLVDELTEWHIRILHLFHDPNGWFDKHGKSKPQMSMMGSRVQILVAAFPELNDRGFYDRVAKDLDDKGLMNSSLHVMSTPQGAWASATTAFGESFLHFISEPQ